MPNGCHYKTFLVKLFAKGDDGNLDYFELSLTKPYRVCKALRWRMDIFRLLAFPKLLSFSRLPFSPTKNFCPPPVATCPALTFDNVFSF